MAEKTEFVLGANFGTPYGSGSQLIFFFLTVQCHCSKVESAVVGKRRSLIMALFLTEPLINTVIV
jgi:hypothetical protein